jgi:hypothetical protein
VGEGEKPVPEKRSRDSSGSPEITARGSNQPVDTRSKLAASAIGVESSTIDFKQRLEVKQNEVSSVVLEERTRTPSLQSKVDSLLADANKEKDSLTVFSNSNEEPVHNGELQQNADESANTPREPPLRSIHREHVKGASNNGIPVDHWLIKSSHSEQRTVLEEIHNVQSDNSAVRVRSRQEIQ